jgi:hypothetical protein
MGRITVRFDRSGASWLRRGLQWHCETGLDTGTLRWSTVHRRVLAHSKLGAFLRDRGWTSRAWPQAPARSAP